MAGAAVVQDDRRLGQQRRDEEVPHHPAGRGEPEHAVAGLGVDVQVEHLQLLEQDAAVARGRSPSAARSCPTSRAPTAGGRTAPARTRARAVAGRAARPRSCRAARQVGAGVEVAEHDRAPATASRAAVARRPRGGRSRGRRSGSRRPRAAPSARSGRTGRRRCARRSRASTTTRSRRARAREERRDRLGDVRHVGRRRGRRAPTPSARSPAAIAAVCARSSPHVHSSSVAQLGGVQDRHLVGLAAEHVLRVVQPRAGVPLRARASTRRPAALPRRVERDVEELPDRAPEAVEVVDRPAPQVLVVVEARPRVSSTQR